MKAWGKLQPVWFGHTIVKIGIFFYGLWLSHVLHLAKFSISYSIFRVIDDYYADGEAAYDMRKPLTRDKERKTIRENGKNVHVEPYRVW